MITAAPPRTWETVLRNLSSTPAFVLSSTPDKRFACCLGSHHQIAQSATSKIVKASAAPIAHRQGSQFRARIPAAIPEQAAQIGTHHHGLQTIVCLQTRDKLLYYVSAIFAHMQWT